MSELNSITDIAVIQSQTSLNLQRHTNESIKKQMVVSQTDSPHFERESKDIDRGYAYVIMVSAFTAFIFHGAVNGSSTFTYQSLLQKYGMSSTAAVWVFSLCTGVRMFSSPVITVLHDMFSYRTVAVLGGILYSTGLMIMAYVPEPWIIYLGFGIISGIRKVFYAK